MIEKMQLIGLSGYAGSGKSSIAEGLYERGYKVMSFAAPIKGMLRVLMTHMGFSPEDADYYMDGGGKEDSLDRLYGYSPRYLMQTLGTEWGRDLVDDYIWIDICMDRVGRYLENVPVVVDDVRFKDEADAIRAKGGVVFRVTSPMVDTYMSHRSESLCDYDHEIVNDGSVEDVVTRIIEIMSARDFEGYMSDEALERMQRRGEGAYL